MMRSLFSQGLNQVSNGYHFVEPVPNFRSKYIVLCEGQCIGRKNLSINPFFRNNLDSVRIQQITTFALESDGNWHNGCLVG